MIWFIGLCVIGLCGCQATTSGSRQSDPDVFPSISVESSDTRPLKRPFTLGILPFDNLNPNPKLHWLGRSLSEMLTHDLAAWPSISIVSRDALGAVLREQWLQQQGFSPTVAPISLGHIQGVRYLVRGGVYHQNDLLTVNVQIVDVETGVVVRTMRAQGPEADIPRLEQDLVIQILQAFESSPDLRRRDNSAELEEGRFKFGTGDAVEREDSSLAQPLGSFGEHSVHELDLQLSLERVTQRRLQAYQAAKAFWRGGWSVEMGQPTYDLGQGSDSSPFPTPLLRLPIALFMHSNAMAAGLKTVKGKDVISMIHVESHGLVRDSRDLTGVGQLFLEQVRQPHRIYVRALNEQGELLAVFSKWNWQTGAILQNPGPDEIRLPLWPESFVRGVAEFPVSWVERGESHVTFDVVLEPIPDEKRALILEPIITDGEGDEEGRSPILEEREVLGPLHEWIQLKWNPPITETLPVEGYLPANREIVQALLSVQGGKINRVHYLNTSSNPLVSRSLEELRSDLVGYCVSCEDAEKNSSRPTLRAIRLQLTLVKDLHALRIGSRSPSPRF
ncbi:MAG: hypothetical protein OEZ05_09985 [Nitrospirota bacterium]|nr:hypothetical protein [Nitrospirota bacterium]